MPAEPITRRLIVVTVVAGVAAIGLALLGQSLAFAIVEWKAAKLGVTRLMFSSPGDIETIRDAYAIAFALPPVAAWIAIQIHRIRRGAEPGARALAAYAVVPLAGLGFVVFLPGLLSVPLEHDGIEPMLSATNLAPGSSDLVSGLLIAGALWCVAGFRRATRRSASSSTPAPR